MDSSSIASYATQRFTVGELTSLQLVLGNILKALTTTSEDVKTLRSDVDSLLQSNAKNVQEIAQTRRLLADSYCTRDELLSSSNEQHAKVDKVIRALADANANSSRDRDVILSRVVEVEMWRADAVDKLTHHDSRIRQLEAASQLNETFGHTVEEIRAQAEIQCRGSDSKVKHMEAQVLRLEDTLRKSFEEVSVISSALVHRVEAVSAEVKEYGVNHDKERSIMQSSIQKLAGELARSESLQSQVTNSLTRVVESTIDQKIGELLVSLDAVEQRCSSKAQHVGTVLEVRVEGLKEHVMSLASDVSDIKSEVAAFNSNASGERSQSQKKIEELEGKVEASLHTVEEFYQKAKIRQIARDKEAEERASSIVDEFTKMVELSQVEMERKMKQMFAVKQQQHDQVLLETLVAARKEELDAAAASNEKLGDDIKGLRQLQEEMQGYWKLRWSDLATSLNRLYTLFSVDPEKIPEDVSDKVRYLRTLPWLAANSMQTPVLVSATQSPSSIPPMRNSVDNANLTASVGRSLVTPSLGVEVQNWVNHSSSGTQRGVEVTTVVVDGAAYLSGVRSGDVILAVGDVSVSNLREFSDALRLESSRGNETPRLWLRRDKAQSPERRFFA